MIGFVKGKVDYLGTDHCLIDCGGIGYRVFMPSAHLARLTSAQEVKVYTYMVVREDALLLYGFLSRDYYNLFTLLLTVSGVGPKVALGVLSSAQPDEFYVAVQSRDLKFLNKLPGVGKKTAERMLLELKDKVGADEGGSMEFANSTGVTTGTAADDAIEALIALGYSNSEIIPVLKNIEHKDTLGSEDIIRQILKIMAGRK